MNDFHTPRYSVCTPGEPPVQILATDSLQYAQAIATTAEVIYDWRTGKVVHT